MTFLELFCLLRKVIHDDNIGYVVHQTHQEDEHNQDKEVPVVLLAYTIIQPSAVMVKAFDTSVACSAMLGTLSHIGVTDLTFKFVSTLVKFLPIRFKDGNVSLTIIVLFLGMN